MGGWEKIKNIDNLTVHKVTGEKMGRYVTSEDLDRKAPTTGAARIQQLREQERDRIHAERELTAKIIAELEKEKKKKKKSGKGNKASGK